MGRIRGKRQPQGFSEGPLRPFTNSLFRGRNKRHSFNQIATCMAFGVGILGGMAGYTLSNWLGAAIGFLVGCGVGGAYVTKRRFYR